MSICFSSCWRNLLLPVQDLTCLESQSWPYKGALCWSPPPAVLKDVWSLPEQTWSPSVNQWAWLSQTRFTPAGRCVWRREEPPLISSGAPLWFCPRTPLQLWPWTAAKRSRRRDWKHLKTESECLIRRCCYLLQTWTLERLSFLKFVTLWQRTCPQGFGSIHPCKL